MAAVVNNATRSNAERSADVEAFLLRAGEEAGVITTTRITTPLNPNRLQKTLAPWFDDCCR